MSFNPDRSKEVQQATFSHKIKKLPYPSLVLNNNNVIQASFQKHVGLTLEIQFTFDEHLNNVLRRYSFPEFIFRKHTCQMKRRPYEIYI